MRFVLLGTPLFADLVLKELLQNNFKPQAIFQPPYKDLDKIKKIKPELAVVIAAGKIIKKDLLDVCPFINLHPSLLPKYRGPSPLQTAILNQDKETGITIILLDEGMDSGPILAQEKITVNPSWNYLELGNILFKKGVKMLIKIMKDLKKIKPRSQDEKQATYTRLLKREDGLLKPNDDIKVKLKALTPWPGVYTFFNGKRLKIIDENTVQLEGKKPLNITEFMRGYPRATDLLRGLSLLH